MYFIDNLFIILFVGEIFLFQLVSVLCNLLIIFDEFYYCFWLISQVNLFSHLVCDYSNERNYYFHTIISVIVLFIARLFLGFIKFFYSQIYPTLHFCKTNGSLLKDFFNKLLHNLIFLFKFN